MIEPLRKRKLDGSLYTRPAKIEAKLAELSMLSREDLLTRSEITNAIHPAFVPSECLLHFVRAAGKDESAAFKGLYKTLFARMVGRFPRQKTNGQRETMTSERIREEAIGRFHELLSIDCHGYCEKLDYFEVRFDNALTTLRLDASKPAWREQRRTAPLEDEETGEPSAEVEDAAGSLDLLALSDLDPHYRLLLDAAIDSLPDEERTVVTMLRQEYPIESKEPGVLSISSVLHCTEKTVRNRRDRAFAKLRVTLPSEQTT